MLCAAIANAEALGDLPPGPTGLTRRRKAVGPFERLWALACVAAQEQGNDAAGDGLRGITYAQRAWKAFTGDRVGPAFDFLRYQERTGAVGTYWVALAGAGLIDHDTGQLRSEGRRLASALGKPPLVGKPLVHLADPARSAEVRVPRNALLEWADQCHLAAADTSEKTLLREVLVGNPRRQCVARALLRFGPALPNRWDVAAWTELKSKLAVDTEACNLLLPVVIDAVIALEAFHEAAMAVFQTLLWWGTVSADSTLTGLAGDAELAGAAENTRAKARELQVFFQACACKDARKALADLQPLAQQFATCSTARGLLDTVLTRHGEVQDGKLDGGVRKSTWLAVTEGSKVLKPAARFQRSERPAPATGATFTHPYRIEAFIEMLRENAWLMPPTV